MRQCFIGARRPCHLELPALQHLLRLAQARHLEPDVRAPAFWVSLPSASDARRRLVQVARIVSGLNATAFEPQRVRRRIQKLLPWVNRLQVREALRLCTRRRAACAAGRLIWRA
eukprot:3815419-Pleurochrysis_carterae.AAC.1